MSKRDKNKEKVDYLRSLENSWLNQVTDAVIHNSNDLTKLNSQETWRTVGKIQAARMVLR